jgi:hypothetical protein
MPKVKSHFKAQDLQMIEEGLRFAPHLYLTLYAAKVARTKLSYPINTHEGLAPLFDKHGNFTFESTVISSDKLEKFIPGAFFPIESESDFITKIYTSLCIGQESHTQTRRFINVTKLAKMLKVDPKLLNHDLTSASE